MIKVSILYPNMPGSRFDADYYVNVHMPLAMKLLVSAVKAVSVEIGVSGATAGEPPPFRAVAAFTCESVRAFSDAFLPAAAELQSDIPNYTDIAPIIQVSKVSELRVSEPAHAESQYE
jgi:uncharacterized protein (TIGR02118 family)